MTPTFVEAARVLAESILLAQGSGRRSPARLAVRESPGQAATKPKERASLLAFLGRQRQEARDHPEEPAKLLGVGLAPLSTIADEAELASLDRGLPCRLEPPRGHHAVLIP